MPICRSFRVEDLRFRGVEGKEGLDVKASRFSAQGREFKISSFKVCTLDRQVKP